MAKVEKKDNVYADGTNETVPIFAVMSPDAAAPPAACPVSFRVNASVRVNPEIDPKLWTLVGVALAIVADAEYRTEVAESRMIVIEIKTVADPLVVNAPVSRTFDPAKSTSSCFVDADDNNSIA